MKLGLIEVERINAITVKRIELIKELVMREAQPAHPRVGTWRHQFNLEALRFKIKLLDRQRTLLLRDQTRKGLGYEYEVSDYNDQAIWA